VNELRSSISRFDLSQSGGRLLSHAAGVLCHDQILSRPDFGCGTSSRDVWLRRAAAGSHRYELLPREFLVLMLRSTERFVKNFAGAQLSAAAEVAA
jgi:hypothetical protein